MAKRKLLAKSELLAVTLAEFSTNK